MRIAYVCRELALDRLTGSGAQIFASAQAMGRVGHEVYLISEGLAAARSPALSSTAMPVWVPVQQPRYGHGYFTERHGYADRVYDALRRLHQRRALDVVEFVDAGGEALTTLRAKRLLGDFSTTTIAVTASPWATASHGAQAYAPATFESAITSFSERYCLDQADIVIACGPAVARQCDLRHGRILLRPPGPVPDDLPPLADPEPSAALVVWHLGGLRPGCGLDTFLRAAGLVIQREPRCCFVLRGDDTVTGPAGQSYWEYIARHLPAPLRSAVVFDGPITTGDIATLPPAGTQYVLPESLAECPSSLLLAMALGGVVTVRDGSVAADLVQDETTGQVIPSGDASALADALLAPIHQPTRATELARAAARAARVDHATARVADALTRIYSTERIERPRVRRVARELVSVVIPLYNHGSYLPEAVASVRQSSYSDVETVLVDDGSTDPETIKSFDEIDGVVKVRQSHAGLSAARNTGIANCTGRFILPLDADDMVAPSFIEKALSALQQHPGLAYVSGYIRNFGLFEHVQAPVGHVPDLNLVLNTYARATGLFRREALEAVGGYDQELPAYEDWDLQIRLHEAGYQSDILPIVGQLYRRHAGSMTFTSANAMRPQLYQHVLRKHVKTLTPERMARLLLIVAHLWKTQYEPSASVRLQRR